MKLKKNIKRFLRSFGYDIINLKGSLSYGEAENELLKIMKSVNVDLVLDIGAGRGQFSSKLLDYGFKGNILSFEPLSKLYIELQKNAYKYSSWHVFERVAIGDHEGEAKMNISNLVSNSSILDIKSTDYNVTNSFYIDHENTKLISLDSLNNYSLLKSSKNIFIKMDVQGLEHIILSRLTEVNYNVVGIYSELSLVKLYEGQEDYLYICKLLKSLGFDLVYIMPESVRNNRMIQFNGVFLHKSISFKS